MRNEMTVVHPIFGAIRLNEKFARVMELEPFRTLAFKSQLGNKSLSTYLLNAKHTRLTHSVGVMYLTEKLLDACERKFSNYFTITEEERETLLLVALGHDVGHLAFSHSLEDKSMMTHEERTVQIFRDYKDRINRIFGYDITSKVISVFKNNVKVKKQGIKAKSNDKLDILFVFTNLLMGAIDCDRMEYIMTDRYMVFGEKLDFTSIFDHITIVLLNDSPVIGFEVEAVPIIENMLLARFDQYESIYYAESEQPAEIALQQYVKQVGWNTYQKEKLSEFDILSRMSYNASCNTRANGDILERLADIVLNGQRKDLLFKRFTEKKKYEYFMQRLLTVTDREDIISTDHRKITIYNPKKNKIYIKCNDGIVRDITEVSAKIRDYSMDLYFVMVDVSGAYGVREKDAKNIRELFEASPVEIEKKFEFPTDAHDYYEGFINPDTRIKSIITKMANVEMIKETREILNSDVYFNPTCQVPKGVAIRSRETGEQNHIMEKSYFIKIPSDDGTSITKREEYEYKNCTLSQFLKLATDLFRSKGFEMKEQLTVEEGVKIKTRRFKFLATVCGSIVEFACDFSTYKYGEKVAKDGILECELKEGDDLALWCLTNHLKKYGFVETNKSKQTRAKETFGL